MKYIKLYSFITIDSYKTLSIKSDSKENLFSEYKRVVKNAGEDAVLLNVTNYLNDLETGDNQ